MICLWTRPGWSVDQADLCVDQYDLWLLGTRLDWQTEQDELVARRGHVVDANEEE